MTTVAERRRSRKEAARIGRERIESDPVSPPSILLELQRLADRQPNTFKTSPPGYLEQLHQSGKITGEQFSAGQWFRAVFERDATHYPRVTASYNPGIPGHDEREEYALTAAHKSIGILANVLISVVVFDDSTHELGTIKAALDKARHAQVVLTKVAG